MARRFGAGFAMAFAFCSVSFHAMGASGDRDGDKAPFVFPSCNVYNGQLGSASCNGCCANPDKVLKDQFRGEGQGAKALNDWYLEDLWPLIQNKIRQTGNALSLSIKQQSTSLGGFADAQNNANTIRTLQAGSAKAAKNAAPSEALCRFATLSQGLAASEGTANAIKSGILEQSLARQLLRKGAISGQDIEGIATPGRSADKQARWKQYVSTFCDPSQGGLGSGSDGVCQTKDDTQINRDIDFTRTVANPMTIDIPLSGEASKDAINITALNNNLYAHDVMNNMPTAGTLDPSSPANAGNIREYMMLRSAIAKRSVAQNSLASVVAMKAKGSPETAQYAVNLMKELGLNEEQAKAAVGDNPSYYAQMDALTRKMYQGPAFYVNLMENPQNVMRQQSAMKSLELMQQRDIYKSMARSEMLLATLLEIYVSREQGGINKSLVQSAE